MGILKKVKFFNKTFSSVTFAYVEVSSAFFSLNMFYFFYIFISLSSYLMHFLALQGEASKHAKFLC